jgi:hypothetical protein
LIWSRPVSLFHTFEHGNEFILFFVKRLVSEFSFLPGPISIPCHMGTHQHSAHSSSHCIISFGDAAELSGIVNILWPRIRREEGLRGRTSSFSTKFRGGGSRRLPPEHVRVW